MAGDEYVEVSAILRGRTAKAVLLDVGTGVTRDAWLPRSCLFGPDDKTIDNEEINDTVVLKVRQWIAAREGLI